MKIMHLADLHLGKNILEQSMIEDQKYILKQIIDIINEKNIDVVLIAGDIYDKGVPSIEAVNLFSSFLTNLHLIGSLCIASLKASRAVASSTPPTSNIIFPFLTTATHTSGSPLPLP